MSRSHRPKRSVPHDQRWIAPLLAWWHAEMAHFAPNLETLLYHRRHARKWMQRTRVWIVDA